MADQHVIDDVTVVGGGDSGLLAGLILNQVNPSLDVTVVDDFQRDIPQVGKSTYVSIQQILHRALEIPRSRFVEEVRPVFKGTVFFRDWCDHEAFHYPFDLNSKFPGVHDPDAAAKYAHVYRCVADRSGIRTTCEELVEQRKSAYYYNPGRDRYENFQKVAYHLNTRRFNDFLRTLCDERGVTLVDDEIVDVETTGAHIDAVHSGDRTYTADLYVDATGFDRVLKREQDSDFVDFQFPLDSAFNVRVDRDLDDVIPATVVDSGDHGWFWTIDTFDNRDRGYVFASDYVDDDEALAEFLDEVDGDVEEDDVARYSFDSGYHEQAWEENCLAIGNAEGFVEPLQSTGLTVNAQAAVNLANLFSAHGRIADDVIRDGYNDWVGASWESIRDFIAVHYIYAGGDTPFWEDVQDIERSYRVEKVADLFDLTGYDTTLEELTNTFDVEALDVFAPKDFFSIMRHMGVTSDFYEENEFEVDEELLRDLDGHYAQIRQQVEGFVDHSELYRGVLGV